MHAVTIVILVVPLAKTTTAACVGVHLLVSERSHDERRLGLLTVVRYLEVHGLIAANEPSVALISWRRQSCSLVGEVDLAVHVLEGERAFLCAGSYEPDVLGRVGIERLGHRVVRRRSIEVTILCGFYIPVATCATAVFNKVVALGELHGAGLDSLGSSLYFLSHIHVLFFRVFSGGIQHVVSTIVDFDGFVDSLFTIVTRVGAYGEYVCTYTIGEVNHDVVEQHSLGLFLNGFVDVPCVGIGPGRVERLATLEVAEIRIVTTRALLTAAEHKAVTVEGLLFAACRVGASLCTFNARDVLKREHGHFESFAELVGGQREVLRALGQDAVGRVSTGLHDVDILEVQACRHLLQHVEGMVVNRRFALHCLKLIDCVVAQLIGRHRNTRTTHVIAVASSLDKDLLAHNFIHGSEFHGACTIRLSRRCYSY